MNEQRSGLSRLKEFRHRRSGNISSEFLVDPEDLGGNENPTGIASCANEKGRLATKIEASGDDESKLGPTRDSSSEESNEIYFEPVGLGEVDGSTALLQYSKDQDGHHGIRYDPVTKIMFGNKADSSKTDVRASFWSLTAMNASTNERRDVTSADAKDKSIKKFNNARHFWASLAGTNDQSISFRF